MQSPGCALTRGRAPAPAPLNASAGTGPVQKQMNLCVVLRCLCAGVMWLQVRVEAFRWITPQLSPAGRGRFWEKAQAGGSGNSSSQKEKLPVNKLGEGEEKEGGGGGERGILRNHPRGISGVCCALSQWARSTGDLLTAADQSGSERPGVVTPAAEREYKVRRVSASCSRDPFSSSDSQRGLVSQFVSFINGLWKDLCTELDYRLLGLYSGTLTGQQPLRAVDISQ